MELLEEIAQMELSHLKMEQMELVETELKEDNKGNKVVNKDKADNKMELPVINRAMANRMAALKVLLPVLRRVLDHNQENSSQVLHHQECLRVV
jgi:hypothetical protein